MLIQSQYLIQPPGSYTGSSKEEEVRGEHTEETNASTLVRVTSHVTISPNLCSRTELILLSPPGENNTNFLAVVIKL